MIESSHERKTWYEIGRIEKGRDGWVIRDLLVRWNERQETRIIGELEQTEYLYDAHRWNYLLPVYVQPGLEAVEYYLEQAKSAILEQAQALADQEAGFNAL